MSNRFGRPSAQNDLFSSYNRSSSPSKDKKKPRSPYGNSPYGGAQSYAFPSSSPAPEGPSFGAYPGANGSTSASGSGTFRSATPNSRGQYSAATLDELESQNDDQAGALIGKVKMLKDLTEAIGVEIRDSTTLAEKMNDQFENSRLRLKGTMNRMLRMAEKTGVGWKVWLGFFAVVCVLFWYVWVF
ncbi:protein transport protein bet1 [Didymosphaeria variabile]|uniref:Protein transport protein bet1 n=1 Tax=Didymosphaeria variabile TaxID=1932322 RepID=A0A9W8XF78_9PLEO|nr:protein transport protein bet1 [Didymosphaeria variabile]KAJ4348782.1 protein transport protein bet1 [Didymosphaeria variabile]